MLHCSVLMAHSGVSIMVSLLHDKASRSEDQSLHVCLCVSAKECEQVYLELLALISCDVCELGHFTVDYVLISARHSRCSGSVPHPARQKNVSSLNITLA